MDVRRVAFAAHLIRLARLAAPLVALAVALAAAPARAATLPPGFTESVAFSGLANPTALRFASDGRIFVAEKSGLIKVFDNLSDTSPTVFADLRTNVHNFWDRGLLGLALDPGFPANPYVYVLYTYDHELGSAAPPPRWGTPGASSDGCPTPPGATGDGCVVSGRLSRLTAAGNVMSGAEKVLIEDWCQQYPSHSIGSVEFGADGALYVSGGDGASFNFADYGQDGDPLNPCGDPPGGVGGVQTPPTAEGGALRAQDLRTSGDPVTLDGAILRVDPATGAPLLGNPLYSSSSDLNARRIIAHGLRNPFRIAVRPGTSELWVGDVGWNQWEEIDRIADPGDAVMENFGWPCHEGNLRQPGYDAADLAVCESLYGAAGAVTPPHFTYAHNVLVVPGETCPTGSSSVSGLSFASTGGGPYPAAYDGALFFGDFSRNCIWVMKKGTGGVPAPGLVETFVAGAAGPVDLEMSPQGELFYADLNGNTIRRIRYTSSNRPPTVVATAAPTSGAPPLAVSFDGSASSDPDAGDTLTFEWDLDGDGAYDDSSAARPSMTYTVAGSYAVRLRVTDNHGAAGISDPLVISVGNSPPTATITAPPAGLRWKVGDAITFSGSASDAEQGALPASALSWELILHHCPSNCHTHPLQTFPGVSGGSFPAPDHEYPSHLELKLTATDTQGLSDTESLLLDPETVNLAFRSQPPGLQLLMNAGGATTPFDRTVITGSANSISGPTPQTLLGATYDFTAWSDGGTQTHNIVALAPATFTATFAARPGGTFVFPPVADARVQESSTSTNYATSYLRADGGSDPDTETYIRFDVGGLSGPVESAKLRLYAYNGSGNGPAVYSTSGAWTETAITWANRPAPTSAATDDKGTIADNSWVEYDVKPFLTGNGTYDFRLATSSSDGVDWYSREAASLRPELLITVGGPADTTPPDTTITSGPSGTVATDAASFSFSSSESGSSFACRLDGSAFSACTSPRAYAGLAPGGHTFEVRATDAAGNVDPSPAARTWTIAAPATLTVAPDADARVQESAPSTNYAASYLRVDGGSNRDVETYLRFTVTGVSGSVKTAKLRLYAYNGTADGPAVYGTSSAWTETGITWAGRPGRTTGAIDDKGAFPKNAWVEFDVAPVVTGNGVYAFDLATQSNDGVDWYSREAADRRPELVLGLG